MTAICEALPEVEVERADRHSGFSVRGKRFAWFLDDHHGDGRVALNLKVPRGENRALAEAEPELLFIPSYLGARGWLGVWLDRPGVDWDRVELLLTDSYRLTAPKRLSAQLGS